MRIIGIDPGYDRLGIAIIDKPERGKDIVVHSECFTTSPKEDIHQRLAKVGDRLKSVINEYRPQDLAIETLFITKNQKTAMRVAEARGIIIYEAKKAGLSVYEYGPMEIKTSITGDGRSDKAHIAKMLPLLVSLLREDAIDDEHDAIAVALAHSSMCKRAHQ